MAQPPFLLIARETIQFNRASDYDLDVARFSTLLDACNSHPHRHPETCASCDRRRAEAVSLYRGSFLAEFFLGDAAAFEAADATLDLFGDEPELARAARDTRLGPIGGGTDEIMKEILAKTLGL